MHDDLSLSFYCAVENGIVLTVMKPGPILPNLQTLFDGLQSRLGELLLTITATASCAAWSWKTAAPSSRSGATCATSG